MGRGGSRGERAGQLGLNVEMPRMSLPKMALDWKPETSIQHGSAVVEVQVATGLRGTLRSFRVSRRSQEGKTTAFLRPGDLSDAIGALKQAQTWLDSMKDPHGKVEDRVGSPETE